MSSIFFINEANKESLNKLADTDQLYYSELNDWYTTNAFRSLSVKLVLDGAINYKVDNKEYKVQKDHFLLATKQPDVKAYFKSNVITRSICIDIGQQSLDDAFTVLQNEHANNITDYGPEHLKHSFFSENVYDIHQNQLGSKLQYLTDKLHLGFPVEQNIEINRDWFLEIVELIVLQEFKNFRKLDNLNALKFGTRKEIFRRITLAKEYVDENFLKNPDIKTIARESNMSEFHFFRCFRQIFEVSPYQYMLSKRLAHAEQLLNQKKFLISDIATECGFPDVFTFSKAFKKKFGVSPTKINSRHCA